MEASERQVVDLRKLERSITRGDIEQAAPKVVVTAAQMEDLLTLFRRENVFLFGASPTLRVGISSTLTLEVQPLEEGQ